MPRRGAPAGPSPRTHERSPCPGRAAAAELGLGADATYQLDLTGVKASFGLDESVEGISYRDLQQRREVIRDRLQKRGRKG